MRRALRDVARALRITSHATVLLQSLQWDGDLSWLRLHAWVAARMKHPTAWLPPCGQVPPARSDSASFGWQGSLISR